MKSFRSLILFLLTLGLASPRLSEAQVLYGSLTGNVTDSAEASIPGAKIDVVNVATGVSRSATTN